MALSAILDSFKSQLDRYFEEGGALDMLSWFRASRHSKRRQAGGAKEGNKSGRRRIGLSRKQIEYIHTKIGGDSGRSD